MIGIRIDKWLFSSSYVKCAQHDNYTLVIHSSKAANTMLLVVLHMS